MMMYQNLLLLLLFVLVQKNDGNNLRIVKINNLDQAVVRCDDSKLKAPKDKLAESRASLLSININPQGYIYIPLVFHILQASDGTGYVPVANILATVDVMNQAHSGFAFQNVSHDTNFRFFVQGINYWNDSNFFENCQTVENEILATIAFRQVSVFNVFTCNMDVLGYTYLPETPISQHGSFVHYLSFTTLPQEPNYVPLTYYAQGYTLVHEIGHYLGLIHTFDGGCYGTDAADTNPEASPYYGNCDPQNPDLVAPRNCPGNLPAPINNFMDYSMDHCMLIFTPDQIIRMKTSTQTYNPVIYQMSSEITCVASGQFNPSRIYSVCRESVCLTSKMPNGANPPSQGWCHIYGSDPAAWDTCCCPGSTYCNFFSQEVVDIFPNVYTTSSPSAPHRTSSPVVPIPAPTLSPQTPPPVPAALLSTTSCLKPLPWGKANKYCLSQGLRLCTPSEVADGIVRNAINETPTCSALNEKFIWTSQNCGRGMKISVDAISGQYQVCTSTKRNKQPAVCCM